jgi:hypothetical protein
VVAWAFGAVRLQSAAMGRTWADRGQPRRANPLDPMPVENSVRRIKELIESETPPAGG